MADKKPELFIIAGPNGSGKTTVTKEIIAEKWGTDGIYINPDVVAEEQFGGWNNADAVLKAAQYCQKWRYDCLEKKENLIFETVLSSDEKVNFIRLAKKQGYFIRVFFISTEKPEINAARITKRYINGGHTVPIEKIVSRFWKSHANLKTIIPTVDRCYLFDNSIDGQQAELLLKLTDGKIEKTYSKRKVVWTENLHLTSLGEVKNVEPNPQCFPKPDKH